MVISSHFVPPNLRGLFFLLRSFHAGDSEGHRSIILWKNRAQIADQVEAEKQRDSAPLITQLPEAQLTPTLPWRPLWLQG